MTICSPLYGGTAAHTTWHQNLYVYGMYLSYILYVIALLGISTLAPTYLEELNSFLKIYVSLFLIWRFHPWAKEKFTDFDRQMVFNAGIFLLTTTTLTQLVTTHFGDIKDFIQNQLHFF